MVQLLVLVLPLGGCGQLVFHSQCYTKETFLSLPLSRSYTEICLIQVSIRFHAPLVIMYVTDIRSTSLSLENRSYTREDLIRYTLPFVLFKEPSTNGTNEIQTL